MSDLGTAFTAVGLVPGVPDDLRELAARLTMYASGAADSAARLRGLGTQEWVGHAAEAFRSQVHDVPTKLQRGAEAFTAAAGALTAHARVLEDAQRQAGQTLAVWEDAQATSTRWQAATADYHATHPAPIPGVPAPTPLGPPPPSTTDPGAEGRQQAQRQLNTARGELETSAVRLAAVLHDAADGAPHHPGFLSQAWHQVSEFGKGAGEAVGGLAEFAFKETPIYAELDPQGFLHEQEALAKGLLYGVEHPKQFGEALLDWNTWAHDPARAAGHLVPQILAMLLTGGAAGAARGADASERLTQVSEEIDRLAATGTPVFEPVDQSAALKELAELGLDPDTASGKAAFDQLRAPYGGIDPWTDAPLSPGERVAFGHPGITGFGVRSMVSSRRRTPVRSSSPCRSPANASVRAATYRSRRCALPCTSSKSAARTPWTLRRPPPSTTRSSAPVVEIRCMSSRCDNCLLPAF